MENYNRKKFFRATFLTIVACSLAAAHLLDIHLKYFSPMSELKMKFQKNYFSLDSFFLHVMSEFIMQGKVI
jgi:carbonic anhydrase